MFWSQRDDAVTLLANRLYVHMVKLLMVSKHPVFDGHLIATLLRRKSSHLAVMVLKQRSQIRPFNRFTGFSLLDELNASGASYMVLKLFDMDRAPSPR